MTEKKYHPIANIFPLIRGQKFKDLQNDIEANGLLEPIFLHPEDDTILDGRNRYRACVKLGIEPKYEYWDNKGSLVSFVISKNLHRRHLSSSQAAAVATNVEVWLAIEAKKRQEIGNNQFRVREKIPEGSEGKAVDHAAELIGTNGRYVQDAKKLKDEAPDLFESVFEGSKTISQANREYKKRTQETPALPTGKYRVIYADPPWKYNDSGLDNYGHAEAHYPPMTISELCNLDVKELAEDNAVLFFWVTSPFLEAGFKVIKAWGFKYKTSFVWDKIKHNFGHYNSVRHEFLLICTRGSCAPDVSKLFDSVQSIERSNINSQKPEEFRTIIDTLYTHGRKIELFARESKNSNWEVWGNEVS